MRRTLAQIATATAPQHYRDGGHVRGPGTGTSDSIKARLSNGEFVLPNDTVRKVGVRRLQDLVHLTHEPSGKAARRGKFADGGLVEDETKRPNSFGDAPAAAASPGVTQVGAAVPPAPAPAAPAPAPSAAPRQASVADIPTGGMKAPAADGSQDSWANTETGRNLSNIAAALPGSLGGSIPAVAKTGGAISGGINAASRLLNAGAGAAAISALPSSVAAQTAPASAAGAGRGVVNPAFVDPAAPPPVADSFPTAGSSSSPSTTGNVTRVGNAYSGSNVAGDITVNGRAPGGGFMNTGDTSAPRSPVGMSPDAAAQAGLVTSATPVGYNPAYDTRITGQGARDRLMATATGQAPGGQISQQNLAAADNLVARQDQGARGRLMALVAGPGAGPVEAGSLTGGFSGSIGSSSTYGNMLGRSPGQRLRDAGVAASSITNQSRWAGRGAENSAAMQEYRAALQQDSNIRQNQAGQDLESLRQTGALTREGLQQSGETQRAGLRAQGVNDANQIARGRLSLEQIAAGYTNRSADRIDRAQVELETAKTPAAQRSARERLMALAGKAPQNEWGVQVTPATKNADGSSTQGSVWRYNKQTGETVQVDGGQRMDISKDPRALAIRDNPKLTYDQKKIALAQLGF